MTVQVVALLDPPSRDSFGMVPFVVNGDGLAEPIVVGLAKGNMPISHGLGGGIYSLEQLIAAGHARALETKEATFPEVPSNLVAGWVGYGFLAECRRLGLPKPCGGAQTHHQEADGLVWIEPPSACYPRLEEWILSVAPRAFKERSKDIAKLMAYCNPCHEVTCAADWYADDSPGRSVGLRFALISLDHDRKGWRARRAMRERLQKIVDRYLKTA